MSAPDAPALWERLRNAGLVDGEMPPDADAGSPWFVRAMLGVAGWLGAVFLFAFVMAGLDLDEGSSSLFIGVMACAAAGLLLGLRTNGDFATQFGFAVSVAGQGLVLFGLFDLFHDEAGGAALLMGLFQTVLFFAVPSFVHRIFTAYAGGLAYAWVLVDAKLAAFAPALLAVACGAAWLVEFRVTRGGSIVRAGASGLSLALVTLIAVLTWHPLHGLVTLWAKAQAVDRLFAGVIGGAMLLWVCLALVRERRASTAAGPPSWTLLAPAAIAAVASLRAPGLAPAVMLVVLGFGHGNRLLLGLGVAAVLGYLSAFYYSLEATLLVKSAWLAGTGAALLAARWVLFRQWSTPSAEARDA